MKKVERLALYGLLTAVAMILSYVESLVPLSFAVPGVKLGLTNIAVVFALYRLGVGGACCISFCRVFLVGLLFGNFYSFAFSVSGACLSLLVMAILYGTKKFGTTGVSVAGAVAHNAGQLAAAAFLLDARVLKYYFPVLCVSGVVSGICIGLLAALLIKRVKPHYPANK